MELSQLDEKSLEAILEDTSVGEVSSIMPLDEIFVVDSSCEVLDEARIAAIPGLPSKENREMVLRVKVAQAGVVNRNNRLYPKAIIQREVQDLSERIQKRAVFSNDQHPRRKVNDKGQIEYIDLPNFGSTTFIPYTLEFNESTGEVFSTGVVPSTEAGRNYAAVIRAGGRPGISTRGAGSTKKVKVKLEEGKERDILLVQEDFKMRTFDTVFDQSLESAGIQTIQESQSSEPLTQKKEETSPMKVKSLAEWQKSFPEASTALFESVAGGSVKLKELSSLDESLYETLCEAVKPDLQRSIEEAKEKEIRQKLIDTAEEQIQSIRESVVEEELEEAKAVAIAELFSSFGIDEEIAAELRATLEENGEEAYKKALLFTLGSLAQGQVLDPQPTDESMTKENIAHIVEESVASLRSELDEVKAELEKTRTAAALAECMESFPYNSEAKEIVRDILESCESADQVRSVYKNQVELLKKSGAKEEAQGSGKFLPTDEATSEAGNSAAVKAPVSELSLDEALIAEAAKDFQTA
jgi:hypothetical protein